MVQTILIRLESIVIELVDYQSNGFLNAFYNDNKDSVINDVSSVDIILSAKHDGLHLPWNNSNEKPLLFHIDVEKIVKQLRSYPAPKQGAFNQALGKKTKSVIDATGGWGGDALLMCCQGYSVTVLERQAVMALLLSDAMFRLSKTAWAQDNDVGVPKVVHVSAHDYFSSYKEQHDVSDCVYLDPMFPPKKKKSAAVNKQMQLLQWMVGEDQDASELVESALAAGVSRIAVKRPDYAEPLYKKPSSQFSSKLVHYDVYLSS